MSLETLILFATATATFAFMPGPAILYVVACTLSGGREAGFRATAGVHLGGYVHVFAAVAGLAILLQAMVNLSGQVSSTTAAVVAIAPEGRPHVEKTSGLF